MSSYLLDVNVLLALHWPRHKAHEKVMHWFRLTGKKSFSTCAITQAGFVRVITNPSFSTPADMIGIKEAQELLHEFANLNGHTFLPIDIGFIHATVPFEDRLFGHRQVTDAYLLGLAIQYKNTLVTLDRAILHLAGERFAKSVLFLG